MKPGWRQGYSYSYKGAASIHAEARKYLKYSYERIFASPGSSSFAADCKSAETVRHLTFPLLFRWICNPPLSVRLVINLNFPIHMKKESVKKIIDLIITILTAVASAFCVQSCRG